MTEWTKAKFSEQPKDIFPIAPGLFMQTKNTRFISEEEGYECETREVTESELLLLKHIESLEETINAVNVMLLNSV